ncbi:thioesterase domain-containing protein [Geomonas sp. RF6]|uniref:YiiD C-terminal domain-containing protein n=1 Tax=Geomonas sp. RF6 TaxID=2897342 RepID=UPI001E54664A|nr:YiiD C-terminal domain-containing protein [Geomonas sp. RF6]UFS70189.1 thioesterase domain-containing protein [Geomonas sp. RF6]
MTPTELQQYLHENIPLSKVMEVAVVSVTEDSVVLTAPLPPNINHQHTVFGGSASAVAILAAWSLVHVHLSLAGISTGIVIQRNSMEYLRPMWGAFTATSHIPAAEDWKRFVRMLERRGIGRIVLPSVLQYEGEIAGAFEGEFVATLDRS